MRAGSAVPGRFLCELYAGGESEFGVDVGEVGSRWRGETKSRVAMSLLASPSQTSRTTSRSVGVSGPPGGGATAFAATALCVGDRLVGGQAAPSAHADFKVLLRPSLTKRNENKKKKKFNFLRQHLLSSSSPSPPSPSSARTPLHQLPQQPLISISHDLQFPPAQRSALLSIPRRHQAGACIHQQQPSNTQLSPRATYTPTAQMPSTPSATYTQPTTPFPANVQAPLLSLVFVIYTSTWSSSSPSLRSARCWSCRSPTLAIVVLRFREPHATGRTGSRCRSRCAAAAADPGGARRAAVVRRVARRDGHARGRALRRPRPG